MTPYSLCLTPVHLLGVYLFLMGLHSHKQGNFLFLSKNISLLKNVILICLASTASFLFLLYFFMPDYTES